MTIDTTLMTVLLCALVGLTYSLMELTHDGEQ